MDITRELLDQRRAALMADQAAIAGALQQVDWTLALLDAEPPKEEAPPWDSE